MATDKGRASADAAAPALGVALALAAFALFTVMDSGVKLLGGRYHVLQVVYLNCLFGLAAVTAIALARGHGRRAWPRRWRLHLARWGISWATTLLVFWSYPRLPLADVYAILFTSPLLITALSVPLLGERVGWRGWTAVGVGFLGVLLVLEPGRGVVSWPALTALLGAVGYALNMLLVRKMGVTNEPVEAIAVAGNLLTLVLTAPLLPLAWKTPSAPDLAISAGTGLVAGSAFLLLCAAYRTAPAAMIAPFQYSQMLHGVAVGWLLFGERPSARTLLGAGVVIASGLYVLRRDASRAAPAPLTRRLPGTAAAAPPARPGTPRAP